MTELSIHSDEHFMRQALKEADKAYEKGEIPIGAVVVSNKTIIARGHNQVEQLNDCTAHAEMLAITSAQNYLGSKYLDQCTLYVTLEPCVMCAGALYWAQLEKLIFAAKDEKRGFSNQGNLLHPKTKILSGLLEEESSNLIKSFFKQLRGNNS
ncbi:MAG: nucleoside deaminase [Cyclobacteriaceae bacterium]|nr:nucleoside deaminase [Cyclobacteriaceae bacterium SS2]